MKTQGALNTIDEYIAGFPADVQRILDEIRHIVRSAAPGAAEAIKYQILTFELGGNLVHFAAFDKHIGFYPTPSGIEAFKDELSGYHSATRPSQSYSKNGYQEISFRFPVQTERGW